MKNEDMKKQCSEERKDSNHGNLITIVLFIVFLSGVNFSQSINGFCLYGEFSTVPENKKFLIDKENLLAYGSFDKSITLHKNFLSPASASAANLYFPYLISDIQPFGLYEKNSGYFFVSRKERRAGWFLIEDSVNLKIIDEIKFESYPERIIVDDFNKDGKVEGIVSGNAFDGLSILKQRGKRLSEEKIAHNRVFSGAASIDLDYDDYPDIAAIDLFSSRLVFFYNNQSGGFYESRSLDFEGEIKNVFSTDFNSDGFNDLILSTAKNITILIGDSVSSFRQRKIVKTEGSSAKILSAKLNDDKFVDFILSYPNEEAIKYLISEPSGTYAEIAALIPGEVTDLVFKNSLDNATVKSGLFVLTNGGKIINISRIKEPANFFRISLAGQPRTVTAIGNKKNLTLIDLFNNSLKIISSTPNFLFNEIKNFNLSQSYSDILSSYKIEDALYLFDRGSRLIDILKFDKQMKKVNHTNLYTNKPIEEIRVVGSTVKDSIYALVEKDSLVERLLFEFEDFRYAAEVTDSLFSSSIASKFSLFSPDTIYSWTVKSDSLYLNAFHSDSIFSTIYSTEYTDSVSVEMFGIGEIIINIIEDKNSVRGLSIIDGKPEYLFIDSKSYELITNNESLFKNKFYTDGYLYVYKNKNLIKFTFDFNALKYVSRIETEGMNSYFVSKFFKSLGNDKKYLIYTSPGKSYITFRWID